MTVISLILGIAALLVCAVAAIELIPLLVLVGLASLISNIGIGTLALYMFYSVVAVGIIVGIVCIMDSVTIFGFTIIMTTIPLALIIGGIVLVWVIICAVSGYVADMPVDAIPVSAPAVVIPAGKTVSA